MSIKADNQEYYENQSQTRVLYIPNLSVFLLKLHEQTLRVPHEITIMNVNQAMGATEKDIINSITRGVDCVYVMLAPIRALLSSKAGAVDEYIPSPETLKLNEFKQAMKKLEWCYLEMEAADLLNERTIDEELPSEDDQYEYGGGTNDIKSSGTMPTPQPATNDEALGALESQGS